MLKLVIVCTKQYLSLKINKEKRKTKMKNKKGFTIVELVIVIAVIAILAAVLIPTFSTVIAKANQSSAQQTATSALKAGLLMTNTAQLPADTVILVDSDKNASTNADYGYKYKNGNELEQVEIVKNNAFDSTLLPTTGKTYTLLIGDAFGTFSEDETVTATSGSVTAGTNQALILSILKYAFGSNDATVGFKKDANNAFSNFTVTLGTTTYDVFTSVDMPKNVVVFVPQNSNG